MVSKFSSVILCFCRCQRFPPYISPLLSGFASLCVCTAPQDSLCFCFSPADPHCLFFGTCWPCSGAVVEFFCCPAPGLVLGMSFMPPQSFCSSFPGQSTLSTISLEGFVQDNFVPLLQEHDTSNNLGLCLLFAPSPRVEACFSYLSATPSKSSLVPWGQSAVCCLYPNTCVCAQLRPNHCTPMDCSPPGFSAYGIFQARILEWMPFPTPGDLPDPSWPRHQMHISLVSCFGR